MTDRDAMPLGRRAAIPERFDRALLFPIERAAARAALPGIEAIPMAGEDRWTAYEVSWLDPAGKPEVAIASLVVPAGSPRLVESKSAKLYLAAMNLARFDSPGVVRRTIAEDFGAAVGAPVEVTLTPPSRFASLARGEFTGISLDALPAAQVDALGEAPAPKRSAPPVEEALHTDLFRSVCPVTGQPDYASIRIEYAGQRLDHAALLQYLVSFRLHAGFHEHCVERIFVDLWRVCRPRRLTVDARFARRGGIDINPLRSSERLPSAKAFRTARQ